MPPKGWKKPVELPEEPSHSVSDEEKARIAGMDAKINEDMTEMLDRPPSGIVEGAPHYEVLADDRMLAIVQPNKYRHSKRTKTEIERDFLDVANWYLRGYSHQQISDKLSSERPYSISRPQVTKIIHAIYQRWQEAYITDINKMKVRELAKIDWLEGEYFLAWEESKKDRTHVEAVKSEIPIVLDGKIMTQGKGENAKALTATSTKLTTKKEKRDPNFMYLTGIQWCVNKRCEILGLNAPKTVNFNWREQAAEQGYNPDELVENLAEQFVSAASRPRSGNAGSLGEGAEED